MIITLENVRPLLQRKEARLIQLSPMFGLNKMGRKYWQVVKPLPVLLSTGQTILIPEGFETDLSSVPPWLWSLAPPYGNFLLAALIHDYLYVNRIGTRKAADREMLIWSRAINSNQIDNYLRYLAVRCFGKSWWNHKVKWGKKAEVSENK